MREIASPCPVEQRGRWRSARGGRGRRGPDVQIYRNQNALKCILWGFPFIGLQTYKGSYRFGMGMVIPPPILTLLFLLLIFQCIYNRLLQNRKAEPKQTLA